MKSIINIAIVEDERIFVNALKKTLYEWQPRNTEIQIHEFACGEDVISSYGKHQINFDIIFMDIELEGITGTEASIKLRKLRYENAIVFTTSHTDLSYVQQGFEVDALQYYKKPITLDNVQNCMQHLENNRTYSYTYNGNPIYIPYKEIEFFNSSKSRNYVDIYTLNHPSSPIKHRAKIANILKETPSTFVQCNRSTIVNITHLTLLEGSFIKMRSNLESLIPVSEQHIEQLLAAFDAYQK